MPQSDIYMSCFVKTARVQLRHSWVGVVATVISPLLAVLTLYLAQLSLYKTTHLDRYKCGCKCIRHEDARDLSNPSLPPLCVEYDEETCGLMYSTAEQAPFCDVTQPPLWPAVLQVPQGTGSEAAIFYTGEDLPSASSVMARLLVTQEELSKRAASAYVHSMVLDDLQDEFDPYDDDVGYMSEVDDFLDTTGALTKGLYDFGVTLGTTANQGDLVHHQMLVDGAFVPNQGDLYVLTAKNGNDANDTVVIDAIASSIGNLTNKYVRPLFTDYESYDSVEAMQQGLRQPNSSAIGGFDWRDSSATNGLHVDIYVDSSAKSSHPTVRWAQSINIAFNAYLLRFNDSSFTLAGIKDMPRRQSELRIDFSILLGPLLTVWIMHIVLPVELYYLVYEKERSLRVYQYLNGVRPVVYYAATWSTHLLFYMLIMSTFVSLAYLFRIKMMVLNSFSVQLMFWMLWGSVITSFGFLISKFFKKKRSVILLSLLYVVVCGFVANVFLVLLVERGMHGVVLVLQSLIPSLCAFRGLYELSSYAFLADQTNGPGLEWSMFRSDPGMFVVLIQLAVQSLVIPLLALYLERDWLLFFGEIKKCDKGRGQRTGNNVVPCTAPKQTGHHRDDALDHYLGYLSGGMQFDSNYTSAETSPNPVSRRDSSIGYYFSGSRGGAGGNGRNDLDAPTTATDDNNPDGHGDHNELRGPSIIYQGIRKVQTHADIFIPCLAVHDREIFCFLTDNLSTASTLLKMVQGLSHQDEGIILVHGKDSRHLIGELRTRIATVFNGDILFEDLTGMEHLEYYVRTRLPQVIKMDAGRYIQNVVDILELHSAIGKRVSQYSSGMRRRLSLAISLLGYPDRNHLPEVLLMHEPSRSMDPYSRKVLWRALSDLRQKTAVIIATSSISEAEACDRIAVMKEGTPIFVGSPQHLIFKRGRFMFLSFTTSATAVGDEAVGGDIGTSKRKQLIRFVRQQIKGAEIVQDWGQKIKFKVPLRIGDGNQECEEDEQEAQTIDSVFRAVERARANNTLDVLDYKVHNCNLEDVYINMMT